MSNQPAHLVGKGRQKGTPTLAYPFQQLAAKPNSRSIAIKAMCAQCAGGPTSDVSLSQKQYDSDWKATIRDCPSTGCPLHVFRPYQARKAS